MVIVLFQISINSISEVPYPEGKSNVFKRPASINGAVSLNNDHIANSTSKKKGQYLKENNIIPNTQQDILRKYDIETIPKTYPNSLSYLFPDKNQTETSDRIMHQLLAEIPEYSIKSHKLIYIHGYRGQDHEANRRLNEECPLAPPCEFTENHMLAAKADAVLFPSIVPYGDKRGHPNQVSETVLI